MNKKWLELAQACSDLAARTTEDLVAAIPKKRAGCMPVLHVSFGGEVHHPVSNVLPSPCRHNVLDGSLKELCQSAACTSGQKGM